MEWARAITIILASRSDVGKDNMKAIVESFAHLETVIEEESKNG